MRDEFNRGDGLGVCVAHSCLCASSEAAVAASPGCPQFSVLGVAQMDDHTGTHWCGVTD